MEVQMTDFENAAFAVFVVLLTRVVMSMNLSFYLPISKVDENMQRAHHRGALRTEKFYFRRDIFLPYSSHSSSAGSSPVGNDYGCDGVCNGFHHHQPKKVKNMNNRFSEDPPLSEEYTATKVEDEYEEMTIAEVLNGKVGCGFTGLSSG